MNILWTEPAVEDLHELHEFIARDSEFYASRFVERIIASAEMLVDHPRLGRIVPEANDEDIRELLYRDYRIIYRVTAEHVAMLAVIHGARELAAHKQAPWEVD